MIAIGLLVSPLPKRSLRAVWPLLLALVLYWVIARWPWTETQLGLAWWGMLLLGSGLALAGFGGCTVNLVEAEAVDEFLRCVPRAYEGATGLAPRIYVCAAEEGVRLID